MGFERGLWQEKLRGRLPVYGLQGKYWKTATWVFSMFGGKYTLKTNHAL